MTINAAASSTSRPTPSAFKVRTADLQPSRASRNRTVSAANAAIGPPTKPPTTGTTKNPTIVPRATTNGRYRGAPTPADRAGRVVDTTSAAPISAVAAAATPHRAMGEP